MLRESLRAHLLQFEKPLTPSYDDAAGVRILVSFLGVAFAIFFALRFGLRLGLVPSPAANLLFVVLLLAAFFLLQRAYVRLPLAAVGLRRFPDWTRRERLYFFQVVALAVVAFSFVFAKHLLALVERHGPGGFLLFSVLTGLLWGMVQEFLYRGWLQTEFTRRWGAIAGVVGANLVFTFGPLHLDYFFGPVGTLWGRVAAVFAIGLFFGLVYHRSGNLWIPAVLHGLWPPNMT